MTWTSRRGRSKHELRNVILPHSWSCRSTVCSTVLPVVSKGLQVEKQGGNTHEIVQRECPFMLPKQNTSFRSRGLFKTSSIRIKNKKEGLPRTPVEDFLYWILSCYLLCVFIFCMSWQEELHSLSCSWNLEIRFSLPWVLLWCTMSHKEYLYNCVCFLLAFKLRLPFSEMRKLETRLWTCFFILEKYASTVGNDLIRSVPTRMSGHFHCEKYYNISLGRIGRALSCTGFCPSK